MTLEFLVRGSLKENELWLQTQDGGDRGGLSPQVLFLDHPKKKIRDTQKYKPFKSQVRVRRAVPCVAVASLAPGGFCFPFNLTRRSPKGRIEP